MSNIDAVHKKYTALDKANVIKKDDTTNLNDIQLEVDKIYEWENEYYLDQKYRSQLPEPTRRSIEQEFENASNLFSQVVKTRAGNIAEFARRQPSFVSTVKNYYKSLYDTFVRDYRGWRLEHSQADKIKELDEILAEAAERQKNIQQREEEVEKRAEDTAELTKDLGLTELSKHFYHLVNGDNEWMVVNGENRFSRFCGKTWYTILKLFRGYQGAARIWLGLAVVAFSTAFYVAYNVLLPFVEELTLVNGNVEANASVIYAVLLAKSLILLVPVYAIRFCLKNYGSNKHLAADALHKAKTLQTLPTFLAIPRDNRVAIREIATTVARLVFTPAKSGFITQKGDYGNSDITINTPQVKLPS